MLTIQAILHPTDFSEASVAAFQLACSLARDHGARLVVAHVLSPPVAVYDAVPVLLEPEGYREERMRSLQRIQPADPVLRVEHRLLEGEPAWQILRLARETGCDLIVMGTHGRRGLRRLLMGSVAEKVVRESDVPVLLVTGDESAKR